MFQHISGYELTGIYDHQQNEAHAIGKEFNILVFDSLQKIIEASDALDILTPVGMHYKYASQALMHSRHVLLSGIISEDIREARQLNDLAIEAQVNLKVLQEDKLHPEVKKIKRLSKRPVYIELNRFQNKVLSISNDSLIFGALLNDLELLTYITGSNIRKVTANATQLFNDFVDFVNVRLEFENGCTCNINCGNFENGQNSNMRIFQKSECIRLDLETYQITKLIKTDLGELAEVPYPASRIKQEDLLAEELAEFAEAVHNRKRTTQDVYQAYQSLKVAHQIIEKFHPSTLFDVGMV
jgi:predicted dehydrogenase